MSYINNLKLGEAFSLVMRTMPILVIRFAVMLAFWVVALIYLAIVGGVAFLIAQAIPFLGWIIFLIAIGSLAPIYSLAYRYVFYMIKAAHIAVIAELLDKGAIPGNVSQLEWGKQQVTERFGEVNGMFVVDEMVTGTVHAFTHTVYNVIRFLPGDQLDFLIRVINRIVHFAMNYIDEAVLARSFWNEEQNIYENARDGVVLYAMAWKPILAAAVALMLISFIPAIVAIVLFAAPIGGLLYLINPALAGWSVIFILLFAFLVKVAIGDAFALAAMVATYQRETKGLSPDPAMVEKLDSISDQFSDLKDRAMSHIKPKDKPKNDDAGTLDSELGTSTM